MVKYNANWEIMNTYKYLQIVQSQFFTNELIFIYIWSNSNVYWFIGILIHCQRIQKNSYSVTFNYLWYSVSYLMSDNAGNFELFAVTYALSPRWRVAFWGGRRCNSFCAFVASSWCKRGCSVCLDLLSWRGWCLILLVLYHLLTWGWWLGCRGCPCSGSQQSAQSRGDLLV